MAMRNNIGFILALILFDGVAVAWAAWEFWSVRPRKKAKAAEPVAAPPPPTSEEDPGHLEG